MELARNAMINGRVEQKFTVSGIEDNEFLDGHLSGPGGGEMKTWRAEGAKDEKQIVVLKRQDQKSKECCINIPTLGFSERRQLDRADGCKGEELYLYAIFKGHKVWNKIANRLKLGWIPPTTPGPDPAVKMPLSSSW